MGAMKRIMLIVWMIFCLLVGGIIVLSAPLTLINAFATAPRNIAYLLGTLTGVVIGILLLLEFNRARKSLKRAKFPESARILHSPPFEDKSL
jgi:cytochrome c biogenesis factor